MFQQCFVSETAPMPRHARFESFEVNLSTGELRRNGEKVKLPEQSFQVLAMLLAKPGELVPRQQIQQRLWPSNTVVEFENSINAAVKNLRIALGDSADQPRYIETLPRRGYRFIACVAAPPVLANEVSTSGCGLVAEVETLPQRQKVRESLAVLPLENLSRDPGQEYLANGLTDALTTSLAKFSGLSVTSSTTAMHYKGIRKPLPEIARELGVTKLIEGTIQRFGDRIRISVKLIDAGLDIHLWAECYERDLRDLLVLEAEIARAVANEIRLKLTPEELNQLTSVAEFDPVAYDAFLKGRYYWSLRTLDGYEKGAEYFRQAIEKDSSFAAPEAGIAELVWRCIDGLDWLRNEPRFMNLLRVLQFAT